jgi:hypothetical protein
MVMPANDDKRVHHLAERKGFRLDKMGPADDRYHIVDLASGGKMPSDAPGHPYSFTIDEAMAWLKARGGGKQ